MNINRITKLLYKRLAVGFISLLPSLRLNRIKIVLYNKMGYKIGINVVIASSCKIIGNLELEIGNDTFIGHETMIIGGHSKVSIGSNVDISSRVSIFTGTHEIDCFGSRSAGKGLSKDIVIEEGVWIGYGTLILPGVRVGKKSVIGAGSVVTKNIPPYSIAVGNPCRVIREIYD